MTDSPIIPAATGNPSCRGPAHSQLFRCPNPICSSRPFAASLQKSLAPALYCPDCL